MRIEPSLAGATERACRYAFGGKPGKAPLQRGRILKSNVGALGFLRRMVLLQVFPEPESGLAVPPPARLSQ